jgi:putative aldouronate transport system permease protein
MLIESNNIGQSSAIGLWQSVMGVFMVMTTNAIAKKADNESALF